MLSLSGPTLDLGWSIDGGPHLPLLSFSGNRECRCSNTTRGGLPSPLHISISILSRHISSTSDLKQSRRYSVHVERIQSESEQKGERAKASKRDNHSNKDPRESGARACAWTTPHPGFPSRPRVDQPIRLSPSNSASRVLSFLLPLTKNSDTLGRLLYLCLCEALAHSHSTSAIHDIGLTT